MIDYEWRPVDRFAEDDMFTAAHLNGLIARIEDVERRLDRLEGK